MKSRDKNWKIKNYFSDLMTAGHPVTFNILKGNFVDNLPQGVVECGRNEFKILTFMQFPWKFTVYPRN